MQLRFSKNFRSIAMAVSAMVLIVAALGFVLAGNPDTWSTGGFVVIGIACVLSVFPLLYFLGKYFDLPEKKD